MNTLNPGSGLQPPFWRFAGAVLPPSRPAPSPSGVASRLRGVRATLRLWQTRSRARQELLALDDHILRDVGLTPYDVAVEARKPFWRA